ncbi:MAG: hypothetical protein ACREDZ_07765 [Kiloniellales bacterium]
MPNATLKAPRKTAWLALCGALALLAALFSMTAEPALAQEDGYELLPDDEGKDLVFAVCSGCHSIRLVVQQGLSRKRWDKLLDWMVEDQGMAELDPESRQQVLDYLDENLNTDHRPPPPMGQARN